MAWQTGAMKPVQAPRDKVEELRRQGDPRLTESDRAILREITQGPEFAQELAAQSEHDPELAS